MKEQVTFFHIREFDCYNIQPGQQANMSYEFAYISYFLIEECTKWLTPQFIEWLKQPHKNEDYKPGSEFYLIYLDGNIIISETVFLSTEDIAGPIDEDLLEQINAPKFCTTVEKLLSLLVEWNAIINTTPRYPRVTLTREEDNLKLSIESHDSPLEELEPK